MSDISTLYDGLHARINAVLPNHLRLSDPYQFQKCTTSEYRQGYGVRIGPGRNTGEQLSCDLIMERQMTVVLTRISQGRETASAVKAVAEKQLMEDLFLIVKDVESDVTIETVLAAISANFDGDNGIEFVKAERDDILKVEATFTFKYREDLN